MSATDSQAFLERFLSRLVGRTRENYARDLASWVAWLDGRGVPLLDAGRQDVEEYVAQMIAERAWAPATVCTVIGHLAGLYRWCVEEGLIPASPTLLVRRPSRPRHAARVWLGREDLARLLDTSLTWRDGGLAAHTHLWALSGLRPGEPRTLRVEDLSTWDGRTTLAVTATKTPGRARLALPTSTARLLTEAAAGRRRGILLIHPTTRRAWTKATERLWLARLCEHAGVPTLTPYGLRDTFATLALAAGIDERVVMASMRHTSSAQTGLYDRLRDQIEKVAGPRLEAWLRQPPTVSQQAGP